MKATALDLRRRFPAILRALDRNESVTLLHRGKVKGVVRPPGRGKGDGRKAADHPAFGMWRDRSDLRNVAAYVRGLRRGRFGAV